MPRKQIWEMQVSTIYPLYVQKAERKNRTKAEVDKIIFWLTGYDEAGLENHLTQGSDFKSFFDAAPHLHPNRENITGVVCGIRVEEIEDTMTQNIRYLDKLIDELAKGRAMEKILRS